MTTPETLFADLSESSITDGFINRFIFTTGSAPAIVAPPKLVRDNRPAKVLIDSLKEAQTACPRSDELMAKLSVPFDGGEGGNAHKRWNEVFQWQHSLALFIHDGRDCWLASVS
jgi:hypothetical protein